MIGEFAGPSRQMDKTSIALETTLWDPVEHLDSDAAIAAYIEAALEDGDPAILATVLNDIVRAYANRITSAPSIT